MNIKGLNKLFTLAAICMSAVFARTSDNYTSADIVFGMKSFSSQPFVSSDPSYEYQENSLKWKRRHKRRKKAPNRNPKGENKLNFVIIFFYLLKPCAPF